MQPTLGTSLEGRYNILRELGAGGGGIVLMQNFATELRKKLQ